MNATKFGGDGQKKAISFFPEGKSQKFQKLMENYLHFFLFNKKMSAPQDQSCVRHCQWRIQEFSAGEASIMLKNVTCIQKYLSRAKGGGGPQIPTKKYM